MQEDVLGTQKAATGRAYAVCAECGAVFSRRVAITEPGSADFASRSEWSELCPECERLDRQGETPVLEEPEA